MQNILEELNKLYIRMEEHDGKLQKMLEETLKKGEELKSFRIHIEQKENELVEREAKIKGIEDVVALENALEKKSQALTELQSNLSACEAKLEADRKNFNAEVEKFKKESEELRSAFKVKDANVDRLRAELEEEKKNLKEQVIKELIAKN